MGRRPCDVGRAGSCGRETCSLRNRHVRPPPPRPQAEPPPGPLARPRQEPPDHRDPVARPLGRQQVHAEPVQCQGQSRGRRLRQERTPRDRSEEPRFQRQVPDSPPATSRRTRGGTAAPPTPREPQGMVHAFPTWSLRPGAEGPPIEGVPVTPARGPMSPRVRTWPTKPPASVSWSARCRSRSSGLNTSVATDSIWTGCARSRTLRSACHRLRTAGWRADSGCRGQRSVRPQLRETGRRVGPRAGASRRRRSTASTRARSRRWTRRSRSRIGRKVGAG